MYKKWLVFALCLFASGVAQARATTSCQPTPQGELCVSEVDFARFAQEAYQPQYQTQWCWAASISMVFAYHGHPVAQPRIVSEVYGQPVNMPAQAGIVMAQQLNRTWVDDRGASFAAQVTGAYDWDAGVNVISNQQLVAELERGHPLVIGNRSHAMVLTAVQYFKTPYGPNIVAAGVFDPWPGIGPRALTPDELYPIHLGGSLRFLASVRISDAQSRPRPPPPPPPPYEDGGCLSTSHQAGNPAGGLLLLLVAMVSERVRHRRSMSSRVSSPEG